MSRWTVKQLTAYAKRRMKESPNQRREIRERAAVTQKTRNGYNTAVVLAWFAECGLPAPVPEFKFHPDRKWRFDFAWPKDMGMPGYAGADLAVEVQGGIFAGGAHVRGAALLKEFEKLNAAAVAGFRVLFVTPDNLCTTDFAEIIRKALKL